jgi:hypothetical protein
VRNWQHDEQPRVATRALGLTILPSLLLRADRVIACPEKADTSRGC